MMMMMKCVLFLVSLLAAGAIGMEKSSLPSVESPIATEEELPSSIPANSQLGQSLLSQARHLEEGDDAYDFSTWITDYSIVFQGCYSIKQWNSDAGDDEEDVRILSRGLVRFRLCPTRSCSFFCTGGHGDYIVELATFVQAYVESKNRAQEYKCQKYLYDKCDCEDGDDRDDGFNAEYCEYDCFSNKKKYECIDRNPYNDDSGDEQEEFDVGRYMECNEFEEPDDDGYNDGYNQNNRRMENNQDDDGNVQYYIGPYCSSQGGKIFIGMFTDDTCTNFADSSKGRSTYKTLTRGQNLPYATKSVVGTDCISCLEEEDPNRQNENNNDYGDYEEEEIRVSEACEQTYEKAGKCEKGYKNGVVPYPNNNGCEFIQGVKITREDGFIMKRTPSRLATFFIVLFAAFFFGFGYYVWYLRKKLGVRNTALL